LADKAVTVAGRKFEHIPFAIVDKTECDRLQASGLLSSAVPADMRVYLEQGTEQGQIPRPNPDVDWYVVNVGDRRYYSISVIPNTPFTLGQFTFEVRTPQGNVLRRLSGPAAAHYVFVAEQPGDYFIVVSPTTTMTGFEYKLVVLAEGGQENIAEVEPNDTIGQAQRIKEGVVVAGSFSSKGTLPDRPDLPSRALSGYKYGLLLAGVNKIIDKPAGRKVVVAVIDSGADVGREDIKSHSFRIPGEVPGNFIDDNDDGGIDNLYGINFYRKRNTDSMGALPFGEPTDDHGHGTHVSGTILDVAQEVVQLIHVKIFDASGSATVEVVAGAVNYLAGLYDRLNIDIEVTSNSWGGLGGSLAQVLEGLFKQLEMRNIISVCAAGNASLNLDNPGNVFSPGGLALPSIIGVMAVDDWPRIAAFSNYGKNTIEVAQAGVSVMSAFPGQNTYGQISGTSMACPHESGAVALLKSRFAGHLTVEETRSFLQKSVVRYDIMESQCSWSGTNDAELIFDSARPN
jgi:subtilisin family serine protease